MKLTAAAKQPIIHATSTTMCICSNYPTFCHRATLTAIFRVNQIYLTDVCAAWHPEKEFVKSVTVFINCNDLSTNRIFLLAAEARKKS